jgi:DNA-binding beta-propeller fold protein YncE
MQVIKSFGSEGTKNGQLDRPRGIAVDSEDKIIVAEYGNHRIQIFNTNGESKLTIGK